MRCLTRIEMQAYVDDETGGALMSLVKDHLRECEKCARLYDEVVADKEIVSDALDILGRETKLESVPDFLYPETKRRRKIFPVLVVVAAASLLAAALIFKPTIDRNRQPNDLSDAETMMMEYYDGRDLNKMWHQRSQPLVIKDENGNVIFVN